MALDPELSAHLNKIEAEMRKLYEAVHRPWYSFVLRGLLQGAGVVTGTIVAIALLGWLLTAFGVIPGVGEIADKLNKILEEQ